MPGTERRQHLLLRYMGRLAAAALDEHGTGTARKPADQRPPRDVALGDEGGGQHGVDEEDIEKGNVVADQKATVDLGQVTHCFNSDSEQGQQLSRPGALQALAPRLAEQGEQQSGLPGAMQQVQAHQQQAQCDKRGNRRHGRKHSWDRLHGHDRLWENFHGLPEFNGFVTFAA